MPGSGVDPYRGWLLVRSDGALDVGPTSVSVMRWDSGGRVAEGEKSRALWGESRGALRNRGLLSLQAFTKKPPTAKCAWEGVAWHRSNVAPAGTVLLTGADSPPSREHLSKMDPPAQAGSGAGVPFSRLRREQRVPVPGPATWLRPAGAAGRHFLRYEPPTP